MSILKNIFPDLGAAHRALVISQKEVAASWKAFQLASQVFGADSVRTRDAGDEVAAAYAAMYVAALGAMELSERRATTRRLVYFVKSREELPGYGEAEAIIRQEAMWASSGLPCGMGALGAVHHTAWPRVRESAEAWLATGQGAEALSRLVMLQEVRGDAA